MMGEALSCGLNFDPERSVKELGPVGEVEDDSLADMHNSMTEASISRSGRLVSFGVAPMRSGTCKSAPCHPLVLPRPIYSG